HGHHPLSIALPAMDDPLYIVSQVGIVTHRRGQHFQRGVAPARCIRVVLDVVGMDPGEEGVGRIVLVVEQLDEAFGHVAHRQAFATARVARIEIRHQNMPFPLTLVSGTRWVTSQCSTIRHPSTRKMSTAAAPRSSGELCPWRWTAIRSPSTSTRWTVMRCCGLFSKIGSRKAIAAARPLLAPGLCWM